MSRPPRAPSAEQPSPLAAFPGRWPRGLLVALVFALTFIAYWPALHGESIWDDAGHVTRPDLRSLAGLGRIWSEVEATQQYYPLLHSAFWVEHRLWGDAPVGYHILNVILHALSACLFATLLRRLAIPGAWLAALVFALHPVCVESVAWITEQKNTLSTVLYLCAALAYLRFHARRRGLDYALATGLFVAALLTKTVTATLPAALLVVFWWQRGRLDWRREVAPLFPWFLLGGASGLITAWVERTLIGATGEAFALTAIERVLLAGRVVWFYLGKLLWPANLIFIYPRWEIDQRAGWQYAFPLLTAAALFGLVLLWRRRQQRGPLAAALLFGGTLFPVLGFVNVFPFLYSYVADHFQYLACLAVIALVTAWLVRISARLSSLAAQGLAAGLLLTLGTLTWRQSSIYRDLTTLYETTLERNPGCWMAHNNLGIALAEAGQVDEAVAHYKTALELHPKNAEAENNLGYALSVLLGRPEDALPHFRRALELQPDFNQAHNNLGVALMSLGRSDEGLAAFRDALRKHPTYAGAHYNLGLALARLGRTDEAIAHFEQAVKARPDYAEAELSWGTGLMLTGRFAESVPHFEHAIQLDPTSADAPYSYGRALAHNGRFAEAILRFREALRLNPNFAEAHLSLAGALREVGRTDEAQYHALEARRLGLKVK